MKPAIFLFLNRIFILFFFCGSVSLTTFENYDAFTDGEQQDMEFRVAIEPGKIDCFYQPAKKDHDLEISYQVVEIDSKFNWMFSPNGISDMKINFKLLDQNNTIITQDLKVKEGTHVHTVKNEGVFSICFDNSFSPLASKIINLEIYLYSKFDNDRWNEDNNMEFFTDSDDKYSDYIESLKKSINKIRDDLISVVHKQDERRAIETRDKNIMKSLSTFINIYSTFSLMMIILIGFVQIMLIRSLFEKNSNLKSLFKPVPFFNWFYLL